MKINNSDEGQGLTQHLEKVRQDPTRVIAFYDENKQPNLDDIVVILDGRIGRGVPLVHGDIWWVPC